MGKRIAIMGAGAVGSYIGAHLTRGGYDVTLIDMWGQHVDTMKSDGLRASGAQEDFTVPVKSMHLAEVPRTNQPFDIAFLSMKSYDTEWAAHFIKRFLSPTGMLLSAQNCMNDALVASIVGHNRAVGCVLSTISVALWEPGHVHRGGEPGRDRGYTVFRVGELHGRITKRVEELAEMLSCVDSSKVTSNIWGERWSKLTTNSSSNPVTSMTGLGSLGVAQNPRARLVQIQISKESVLVGQALNYEIESIRGVPPEMFARADEGDVYEELDARFQPKADERDWKSSMAQDVTKGRSTEIEYMNGFIVEKGREVDIPTPVNAAVVEVVKGVDAGTVKPDPSNVERVLSKAGL